MNKHDEGVLDDVRQRGFRQKTPVRVASEEIDRHVPVIEPETVGLQEAFGRVLAGEVISPVNVPGFRRAAMDGFAIQAEDATTAREIIGVAKPGRPFAGIVRVGQAVRITTGAPVPDGADAVIPVERCRTNAFLVELLEQVSQGKHISLPGEDIAIGCQVLNRHRILRTQDVGLLSSMGISSVAVLRKPRVKILVTGGELLPAGTPPTGFQIADSNSVMLRGLVERDGGTVVETRHATDDPATLRREMLSTKWDLLLVSGGTSVGDDDHAPKVLHELTGAIIHGIDMKPGMPTGFGWFPDHRTVFLLPGNPLACLVAYDLLARRALRRMAAKPVSLPYPKREVTLTQPIVSKLGRVDYVRLRIDLATGLATPLPLGGAGNLSGAALAEGFMLVDDATEKLDAGTTVIVSLYEES